MKLSELEMQSKRWVADEIKNGGRFVIYPFTISIIIMTFKKNSGVYFLRDGESPLKHGWIWMLISFVLGWWGFPYGPIYTIESLNDCYYGVNVTTDVLDADKELEHMVYYDD